MVSPLLSGSSNILTTISITEKGMLGSLLLKIVSLSVSLFSYASVLIHVLEIPVLRTSTSSIVLSS